MSFVLLTVIIMFFLFLPVVSVIYLYMKFGLVIPTKVSLIWWILILIYYVALFKFGTHWLDKNYPLQSQKEYVCEIKTTYLRKGIK